MTAIRTGADTNFQGIGMDTASIPFDPKAFLTRAGENRILRKINGAKAFSTKVMLLALFSIFKKVRSS